MLIGYARVSTQDQTLDLQTDALKQAGCEKLFTDSISGTKSERPGLQEAMSHLRAGDTLVVWRLDRLGRTLKHLIATITDLSNKGIGFKSLQETWIPRRVAASSYFIYLVPWQNLSGKS
jgi:DNA invertase Pin-like site-specific DNA recombinase